MPNCNPDNQKRSQAIIGGGATATDEVLKLASAFKRDQCFGDARKLLGYYRERPGVKGDPKWRKLTQEYSLCTYKDVDLLPTVRFDLALQILSELGDLATTFDQETLGQAGATCKYKWEVFNQKADLERSMSYYLRGFLVGYNEQNPNGYGYTGINAAFLLGLLAMQETSNTEKAGAKSEAAQLRIDQAGEIRGKLAEHYKLLAGGKDGARITSDWWEMVTWAEACFGLGKYKDAALLLEQAKRIPNVDPWQIHATSKQLVALAEIQKLYPPPVVDGTAQEALRVMVEVFPGAQDSARIGKVGLGLSGGGFRASLFHIGVLARLAESDVLRHIEVISCVSGGSILGAHYYLELRKLLQSKGDKEITRQDYIDLVARLEKDFLDGVQENLRTKGITSLRYNLKAAFKRHFTITDYMGKLYETHLYNHVQDGENNKPRYLSGLYIQPPDEKEDFYPRRDNWKRLNKVPMLVLNATALNTGHTWQFTASWMGEPPVGADAEVDRNFRLRRVYYDAQELPDKYRKFPLGRAVAASSCVPGLFEPVELDGLYPDITVRLVDGGVHDNQGTSSLLEENCSVILVSDASGQMVSESNPASGALDVPLRSNSILQARVREAEFDDLRARKRSSLLRGLMFLHLKKDLDAKRINWIGHNEAPDPAEHETGHDEPCTSYGIDKEIQHQLAATRTDLDSFSDTEAFALMCSGYAMAGEDLESSEDLKRLFAAARTAVNWRFLEIMKGMKPDKGYESWYDKIKRSLGVSCKLAGKPWLLAPRWCIGVTIPLVAVGIVAVAGIKELFKWLFPPTGSLSDVEPAGTATRALWIGLAVIVVLIVVIVAAAKSAGARRKLMAVIMLPGSLIGMLHRHLYDRHFLRIGSHKSFEPVPAPALGKAPASAAPTKDREAGGKGVA